MFSFAVLALLLVSCHVSGILIPRDTPSEGWMAGYFEFYEVYYARYLALSCETEHGTHFFDQCCRPLLTAEDLSSRPSECDPTNLPYCEDATRDLHVSISAHVPVMSTSEEAPATITEKAALKPIVAAKKPTLSESSVSSEVNMGGYATFYFQGGVAGACGAVHSDYDYIAAIDGNRYGNLGEQSGLCGRSVQITNIRNGRSVIVLIADACPTCENSNSIDLSMLAFQQIASLPEGMVPITWSFI